MEKSILVSEVIKSLEKLKETHGDIGVMVMGSDDWFTDLDITFEPDSGIWSKHILIEGRRLVFW